MTPRIPAGTDRAARVFVVQESPSKNLLPALQYGSLIPLLEPDAQVVLDAAPTVRRLRAALRDYGDADYILAIGDPVAIGIACAVAADANGGRFTVLKWDRMEHVYYPVPVDTRTV